MSIHRGGRGPGHVCRSPLSAIGLGGSGAASISAPTLALHTAAGVTPASWDITGDSTFVPGMYVHQQFAADSGFTTSVVDYYTQVEGSDWEATSETIGNGIVSFVQPSGTYFQRCRFETAPGDTATNMTSAWSNTQTDTITAATTVWASSPKSQYATISGSPALTATGAAGVNGAEDVFATTAKTDKRWFEITLGAMDTGAKFMIGVDDNTKTGVVNFFEPGNGNTNGACLIINGTGIYQNSSLSQSSPANNSGQTNDTFRCEIDPVGHTIAFFRIRSGTQVQVGTTQAIPAGLTTVRAVAAPYSPTTANVLTGNFGQSASAGTPTTGFSAWG